MVKDQELIRQYASTRSEAAFAELVRRHLKFVYAAALRQVNGDCHLAEDVAQSVFTDLARKAAKLQRHGSIAGWLHASTRFAAANAVRREARRRLREQIACAMNDIPSNTTADWAELRPVIDEALGRLGDGEREAILLRYFEALEFPLIGEALGLSESGARMRVERALEKLRGILGRRGLATPTATLTGALAELSVAVVPAHLSSGIINAALTQASVTTTGSVTLIAKLIAMKKIALIAVGILALSLTTAVVVRTARKSPVVKVVTAEIYVTLVPGETVVTGGWPQKAGGLRTLVFITPTWIDGRGNLTSGPQGAKPQVLITAKFTEVPERDLARLGLQSALAVQDKSSMAVHYSSAQVQLLMEVEAGKADVLSTPRMTTTTGVQSEVRPTKVQTIGGKAFILGPSVSLLPTVSSDGMSMDLAVKVRIVAAL